MLSLTVRDSRDAGETPCGPVPAGAFRGGLRFWVATLAIAMVATGCGYHVAGHYNALPKSIHTIAVPALENETSTYRIEQRLTEATVHEFLVKTPYRIVSNANEGDAVLRGKVLSIELLPLLFQNTATATTTTTRATTMLITMKCEVRLEDRESGRVLYHSDNFVFRNEYELSTNVPSFFDERDPAYGRMAADFASRLVAAVTENY
jgi:outer membrane lipopolysaccharide assembly protein LptE/RlpB